MATSGTISSTLTALEIITTAAELIGATPVGDELPAEQSALGLKHLNWMLKTWQADGACNQWRLEEVSIAWPAATATVTLDTNYLDLMNTRRRISGIDTPLTRYSISDYADMPNKTQAGTPVSYMIRKTASTLSVSLWPVPTAITTIMADAARVIEDVTALTQTLDVPQEWLETVFTCLAARLTRPFRTHVSDPVLAQRIEQDAASMYARMKAFDDEDGSVFFMVGGQ